MTAVPRNGNNPARAAHAAQRDQPAQAAAAQETARRAGVPEAYIPSSRALRLSAERMKPAAATDRAFTVAETDERYVGMDESLRDFVKIVSKDGVLSPVEARAMEYMRMEAVARAEAAGTDTRGLYNHDMLINAANAYATAQGNEKLVAAGLQQGSPALAAAAARMEHRQANGTQHVVTTRQETPATDKPEAPAAPAAEQPVLPFDPEAIAKANGMVCDENGVCRPMAPGELGGAQRDPQPIQTPRQEVRPAEGNRQSATRHAGPTGPTDPKFTDNVIAYSQANPNQPVYVYVHGKRCGNCKAINHDALRATARANGGAFFDVDAHSTSIGKLYRQGLTMPVVFKIQNGKVTAEKVHLSPSDLAGRGAGRMFRPGTLQAYRQPLDLAAGQRMSRHDVTPRVAATVNPRGVAVRGRQSCRTGRCGVRQSPTRTRSRRRRGGCGRGCGGGGCRSGSCGVNYNRRSAGQSSGCRGRQRQMNNCQARRRRRCGGFNPFRSIGRMFR